MRFKITLSYDGSAFRGWQIQHNAPTTQQCLESSLSILLNEEIAVTGAGRTDAEVNAVNYVAHFDSDSLEGRDITQFICKINAILPKAAIVHSIVAAEEDFHARFGARTREYKYFIHKKKDPFISKFSYLYTFPLDIDAMNEAAKAILGTKDFSCFEKKGGNNKTSICTVMEAHWSTYTPWHVSTLGYPAEEQDYLVFTIKSDRFLRNMVRAVVGTLLEVGRGKHSPQWIEEVISSGDRCVAGESVPGHSLFFDGITF